MKVKEITAYPVKSLRGCSLSEAVVTKHGLPYDRRFLVVKILESATSAADWKVKNMHISSFPTMCLFTTDLELPDVEDVDDAKVTVTYKSPESETPRQIAFPLQPDTSELDPVHINMHKAEADGFSMGQKYRDWFSQCFGFDCALVYIGENLRQVLCSNPSYKSSGSSWLSSLTKTLPTFIAGDEFPDKVRFQDCVPYLIVSNTSKDEMSKRLPEGVEMDISKFRANIVVEGAQEPWEEDYWAEILVGDARIITAHNCGRCKSLNVNFETGEFGTGPDGAALKTLMRDRRIDPGHKYSPVFGRYSYLDNKDDGKRIKVGDEVQVVKTNSEHTLFDFKGEFT